MTFLILSTAAILGIFTGKFVYLMNNKKQVTVEAQFATKGEKVYNGIKK